MTLSPLLFLPPLSPTSSRSPSPSLPLLATVEPAWRAGVCSQRRAFVRPALAQQPLQFCLEFESSVIDLGHQGFEALKVNIGLNDPDKML